MNSSIKGEFSGIAAQNGQTEKSSVYDVELQSMNKEIENFIINLASSTAKNNEEIATGNFNIAPEVDHIGDFKHIETALVKVIQDLSHTLNEINSVSELVASNAAQSAEAAQNSNELILKAMQAVEDGKKVVDETAKKLLASVNKTNDLVKNIAEITEASDKQSQALAQISDAANQIAAVIQENTAMAEESSASSEELAAQAEKLKELISVFTLIQE